MNSNISIYIPRMSLYITEDIIKEEFGKTIGDVSRVDFTSLDKKPGFNENFNNLFKSAFIHFNYIYNNNYTNSILLTLNNENSYKYFPKCKNEYWILLKAKNPIIETWMNNSQIVENCRFLENKIELQEESIKYLKDNLAKVLEKVYNLEKKDKYLDDMIYVDNELQDTLLFQRKQEILREKKNSCNFSISSHSSMPELLNYNDLNYISSNSSLQEYDDYNSSPDSDFRIKNSSELCGNE